MSEEVKQKIFEPFFTTKGAGKGTGLGLATVYGIVKKAGGYIEVDSTEGQGTSFQLYLPIAERRTDEHSLQNSDAPARGNEFVLLVDDEEPFRKAAGEYLAELGYKVVQAGSAAEALNVCPVNVDIIVTDVLMPGGVRGPQLCERLGDRHPRVILMSGDPEFGSAIDAEKGERFLRKPFRLSDLAMTIRQSLDTKSQTTTGAGK
jgi:CheY-like chemotaxis protein